MGVCRTRVLISAPLPQVWDFFVKAENWHLWGPFTQPVSGINHPLQMGDRITQQRRDFFRTHSQVLLVEQVIPYHSLQMRDLSPGAVRMHVTAIVNVEAGKDQATTWIEEAIFCSLGKNRIVQWLDHWLINPVFQLLAGYGTTKAFHRFQAVMVQSQEASPPNEASSL